ncbi:MAG TPA: tetratricopeptide repeat protein [Sandaracinaceae bacterium LLY-WYZ-13_1]|nr:tetratricopeptide repeat protein [Sandaracinaceae bacterium LLY-WYZ-13_1]
MRVALPLALALLGALGSPTTASADSLEEIYERANAAYFRGDYDAAAAGYRRLVDLGVVDPDVTFDLAVAEARRGRYGEAIRFFERTLWLRPGDDEAREGLEAARDALGGQRAQSEGEAEVDTGPPLSEAVFGGIPRGVLAGATLLFDLALFGVLIALLFARRESLRLGLGIAAPLLGLALIVSGVGLALSRGWLEEGEPAVVLAERASLREGPDPRAGERHQAREGQRAWILDADGGWRLVRIPSVGRGWVEAESIGRVRPIAH